MVEISAIRWDSFDIAPLASGRRLFFPNSYQKAITVPWTNLCDVKCVERASGILERPIVARVPCLQRGSSPGEASTVLAVAFLPVLEKERDLPAQEVTLRHIAQVTKTRTFPTLLTSGYPGLRGSNVEGGAGGVRVRSECQPGEGAHFGRSASS